MLPDADPEKKYGYDTEQLFTEVRRWEGLTELPVSKQSQAETGIKARYCGTDKAGHLFTLDIFTEGNGCLVTKRIPHDFDFALPGEETSKISYEEIRRIFHPEYTVVMAEPYIADQPHTYTVIQNTIRPLGKNIDFSLPPIP